MESKNTLKGCSRAKISRYRPTAITPMSSAARPMRATRASILVPVKFRTRATSSSATENSSVVSRVSSTPKVLATKPEPNCATAVIVTIIAQM